jgi:hypothetical protein
VRKERLLRAKWKKRKREKARKKKLVRAKMKSEAKGIAKGEEEKWGEIDW